MAWVDGQGFRLFLPAFDDAFIRREALEGFQPFGEVVGVQKAIEMLLERLMMFVVIAVVFGAEGHPMGRCSSTSSHCGTGTNTALDLRVGLKPFLKAA
jgi:hypothetical protein